ncbi:hypothetical protein Noda2021_07260 [Candidatus Dependentiae bacterium Noda2021]|nr:hypothetical protein Noda2021_07260 [Candidatus Dependentiae bacterium Noda2021]
MNIVSLRRNSVFLSLLLLFSSMHGSEDQITFTTNQPNQHYAYVTQDIRSLAKKIGSSTTHDTPGLIALAKTIEDDSLEYMPLEVMICAIQEMRSTLSMSSEEQTLVNTYYQQLVSMDQEVVLDEDMVRGRCKSFNQLCVRGNARIGGNLIVCGTICPDPSIRVSCGNQGPAGQTGFTGITGDTGFTGFTGPQGALGALGHQVKPALLVQLVTQGSLVLLVRKEV